MNETCVVVGWDPAEIVSEMEAMVAFRQHKRSKWGPGAYWMVGQRTVGFDLMNAMLKKGLIDRFVDADTGNFERRINPKYDCAGGSDAPSD